MFAGSALWGHADADATTRRVIEQFLQRRVRAERDRPGADPPMPSTDVRECVALPLALALHEIDRLLVQCAIVRQVEEAKCARGMLVDDRLMRSRERCANLAPFGGRDSAGDRRRHHIGVIESDRHDARLYGDGQAVECRRYA